MNYHLKKHVLNQKGKCIKLGFHAVVTDTPIDTVALLSNPSNDRVILLSFQSNILGDPKIYAYLVNNKRYDWARDEGFSLNQMLELKQEKVFIEIDPSKVAEYLL
tara:strand:- start:172 stop:486 length:315 start_codon:yes stop_codon:yes gene_type:complete